MAELRNKVKSQKTTNLQQALQTQEESINMLQKYKTQMVQDKENRNTDADGFKSEGQKPFESSLGALDKTEQERKNELLQKALGLD